MSKSAKVKGQCGEYEVIHLISDYLKSSLPPYVPVPVLERNLTQTRLCGGSDILGLPLFAIEVKRREQMTPALVGEWWQQTLAQTLSYQTPVLFYRKNRQSWTVKTLHQLLPLPSLPSVITMDVSEWLPLLRHFLVSSYHDSSRSNSPIAAS